ncbi:Protein of unknown function [Pedobacter hartonius]|uniref:DUF3891 domain-containing protein n=2 Tax=Pedobacter hartonius TaxID=425514 RepID=A0A1H3W2M7_9SPHI|nr:Protein of unknown function [Pedobacter hartonius]
MIVNYTESGWQIITQRSHGLLAAKICAHWRKDRQPERWVETLIAAAEHDDVYNEWENEDLLNETGGPVNFKQTGFKLEYGKRLIDMAETKSAYIALLISRHIQFVHGEDSKAKTFISSLKKMERNWLEVAGVNKEEVDRAYKLVEFCDAFSLLICQGLVQPEGRKIEIGKGPDGRVYEMHASGDDLMIEPWPYDTDSVVLSWESRTLSQLTFKNADAFRKAVVAANPVTHQLRLLKCS